MIITIFGGAGFVGASIALYLKSTYPAYEICCFDNLTRRGSEINLELLKAQGIQFVHGDIRNKEDLDTLSPAEVIIDASADPSVLGGIHSSPVKMLNTNLFGTVNLLEKATEWDAFFLFMSTSRVYSIPELCAIEVSEGASRFEISAEQANQGFSKKGINEKFSTERFRSFYGSAKLASEMLIQEYMQFKNLKGIINRCGVIAGPGQFGKVDQGVLIFWLAAHLWKRPLSYIGFDGSGKQVRDFLHISDLLELVDLQLHQKERFNGSPYNVGGGLSSSMSLLELTRHCEKITGNLLDIQAVKTNRDADIPIYVTDNSKIEALGWSPKRDVRQLLSDAHEWMVTNEAKLKSILSQ